VNASSVDVPVALLGYGTVGSAVERLLDTSADEIERATGHRLRVVRALVRDPAKERHSPARDGVLTNDAAIRVIGTTRTGFLQNDACWRELPRLEPDDFRAPYYLQLVVADRPGVLAEVATRLAAQEVSVARLLQEQGEGEATLHVVTHTARLGAIRAALAEIEEVPGTRRPPSVLLVVSDSGRAP
jgi:predicted amino acid-binding ACT domain protein